MKSRFEETELKGFVCVCVSTSMLMCVYVLKQNTRLPRLGVTENTTLDFSVL